MAPVGVSKLTQTEAIVFPTSRCVNRNRRSPSNIVELAESSEVVEEIENENGPDDADNATSEVVKKTYRDLTDPDLQDDIFDQSLRYDDREPLLYTPFLLHISYKGNQVSLVCQIRTINLSNFFREHEVIMRESNSRYRDIKVERNPFKKNGLIYAKIKEDHYENFNDLMKTLKSDAEKCKADDCKIINLQNGFIFFTCRLSVMPKIAENIKKLGYEVLRTEVGQCARDDLVKLNAKHFHRYCLFLESLLRHEDFSKIYDNVENSPLRG